MDIVFNHNRTKCRQKMFRNDFFVVNYNDLGTRGEPIRFLFVGNNENTVYPRSVLMERSQ